MSLPKHIVILLAGSGFAAALSAPTVSRSETAAYRAYGRAVAIAGEFAFVGEPNVVVGGRGGRGGGPPAPGLVHIYRQSAAGWKEAGQLVSAASVGGDGFGSALAAEGTTLLVGQVSPPPTAPVGRGGRGAPQPAGPAPVDTAVGSVQLFKRGADMKWTSAGNLSATRTGGAQFGAALAVLGDLVLVGAPGETNGGAVYVFQRGKDGNWSGGGALPAQGLVTGDRFGSAIAIDRDRVAIGAPARKLKGAVYVFRRDASGRWMQETEQVAPQNLPDNSLFGGAVAVKGDQVIVGAPGTNFTPTTLPNPTRDSLLIQLASSSAGAARDSIVARLAALAPSGRAGGLAAGGGRGGANIGLGAGIVITYERASFGSWRMIGTLAPFDFGNVAFGSAIGVVGDELWIGAPGSDGSGRIYRAHANKDGAWGGMTKLGVDSLEPGALWSASFAVSGNSAIVGMPGDGGGGGTVGFLSKAKGGDWNLKSLIMPPPQERFPAVLGKEVHCENGMATAFECGNTGLLSFMPISAVGGKRGVNLSGSWGWTDPVTGHDISIIGRTDAAAFVDVTDPTHPRYLGDLPRTKGANASSWREIKTYKNYALIVSDGSGDHHGIQIFDLTKLRNVKKPQHFTEDAHFDAGSIHDIAVNEASGYAYAVGTSSGGERCSGGSLMIDMKVPLKPTFAGCFADVGTGRAKGGYTHDIQCVMYHGPDKRYTGHEICMASNETTVSIQDVTDKKNVKVLSHADYPTPGYTHQGWFTDDQRHWYLNDELDESANLGRSAEGTRTMVFDVADLEQPIMVKEHIGPTHAIDHNLYVKGDRMYQSNYKAGLRILDISDPKNPKEVGFLDTSPGENDASFAGTWNNYPFFKNGAIGVTSIGEGFFMVRDGTRKPVP
ncbi:MAG: choice-of-anchor B family protein [Gemmatimonadota bacterium]